uniref:FI20862p1 n=1 Tax=Drosophila melanogaster TaxID=7227 RepID=L7S1A0_DROME|nr:uncharacterized protein Dmel_CG33941 [Drosophila melanogaster]AGC12537.1 FI20862p1 [Drosophila melanogaster]API61828.1 uncharacterized protein Dmel_CG33941 [Drosophila melanogaster]|eukprot:NP_001334686.1 uncharacterized protein Dmel_CG33941 [Drosophila melanogaster]
MQPLNSSIDKAKHFFIESGILGPVNFKYSHDMIRKTSTIHIDETLKNQIRKTSLGMRSRAFRENNSLNSFDDTLINLQNEIYNIRDSLVNGETKIILLRTEIGKLKEALQAIMKALDSSDELMTKIKDSTPNLCLFCQPNSYKKFAEFQSF